MAVATTDRIERKIVLNAPRERVWRALTTESAFAEWFGVKVLDGKFQAGARVKMTTANPGCQYTGIEFSLTVEKLEPPRFFSWRWSPGQTLGKNEPLTLVEFALEETPAGTLLTITESGFDRISLDLRAKAFEENSGGWDQQAKSLADYLARTQ